MADYGIKIRKSTASGDVENSATKDLIILSSAESHKVAFNGSLGTSVYTFTHSLGYIPFFQSYIEDASGDLYPTNAYIDDQFYASIYTSITTSTITVYGYAPDGTGTARIAHYTIYYEN